MFANKAEFVVKQGKEDAFVQLLQEQGKEGMPSGMTGYYILRDLENPQRFWLLDIWENVEDKDRNEETSEHKAFHSRRGEMLEKPADAHHCDVVAQG